MVFKHSVLIKFFISITILFPVINCWYIYLLYFLNLLIHFSFTSIILCLQQVTLPLCFHYSQRFPSDKWDRHLISGAKLALRLPSNWSDKKNKHKSKIKTKKLHFRAYFIVAVIIVIIIIIINEALYRI